MHNLRLIWILSLIFKLILSALIPLSADEAYYWVWSHNLQLSYFDHPPMIAWWFYLGHFLEPILNCVRWPSVILGHLTIGIWVLILKDYFSAEKQKIWIYLSLFSPLLGFGSIILTPDLPVLFFWALSIYFTVQAIEHKKTSSYLWLGFSLGLGFCSKYHIVLFVPCLLAYLFFEKKWKEVRWNGVFLTIVSGLLFSTPVILWNVQNNFASFEFQLKHGLEKSSYDPEWTVSYLLGQLLILFPLTLWAAFKAKLPLSLRWLTYFGWGPLLFFLLTSFRATVEANWPIIGYPAVLAIAALYPRMTRWLKAYVVFYGVIFSAVIATLFMPNLRSLSEKINEPYLFQDLSSLTKDYAPLYADTYQMASSLWYFSKIPVYKLRGISRFDFFDTLSESAPKENHFYLLKSKTNGLPEWISKQQWQIKEIKPVSKEFVLLEFTRP